MSCVYTDNKCTVWCQCENCTHNYLRGTENAENLREFFQRVLMENQKGRRCHDSRADQLRSRSSWFSGDLWWKLDLLLWPRDQETEFPVELRDPRKPDRANPPTKFWWTLFDSTGMIYMYWVPTWQTINKEYNVDVLSEFRKRFRRKRPALFKSGQWYFHHNNAPVHSSILAPCDFCLSRTLRGCRYETIEEMKEAVTKVIDTLTQEDFHGAFQTLLER